MTFKDFLSLPTADTVIFALRRWTSELISHCFFIGNCIGQRNRKSFLLFLFCYFLKFGLGLIFICKIFINQIVQLNDINHFLTNSSFLMTILIILFFLIVLYLQTKKVKITYCCIILVIIILISTK